MFKSVLIANRGEIACRVARTARRLGLRTIAVYSDADAGALHVRACDEAHRIGPPPAAESYLVIDRLIDVARKAKADCIHPGYGFLSERAEFVEACNAAEIAFVGPPAEAMRAMGLKDRAKALMEQAGVPVVPGYHGERQEPKFLKEKAYEIGYPVLIKAVAGGGGKGMRRVDKHADFDAALEGAMREAKAAFGDARVLIEKYIAAPRHVEMQVFADNRGAAIHLGERDCSLQRRHQKVVEEAPAPGMTAALRAEMGAAAVAAAKAVGYSGAGTVEFIADGSAGLKSGGFWFMEMNTRLQVEHPVTEMVTGLDLVEWQFRIAAGEQLPLHQDQVRLSGHAVEARLYAEDPERSFLPSTGRLAALSFPSGEGLRVDTGVGAGGDVTPFYDPMIAKVIAHAATREAALDRLADALEATVVAGPRSNAGFLAALCRAPEFRAGDFDTGFIDRNLSALMPQAGEIDKGAVARAAEVFIECERDRITEVVFDDPLASASPWDASDGFQFSGNRATTMPLATDGMPIVARIDWDGAKPVVTVDGHRPAADTATIYDRETVYVLRRGRQTKVTPRDYVAGEAADSGDGLVRAPMHGKVLAIFVEKGAEVAHGQRLAIVEAMKMEHTLVAPVAGTVSEITVAVNEQVAEGARIMTIESANA
ncbi:MAG: biotin carboxylase N-terminal domain-containing protein [Pseudolabrys sp.]